MLDAGFQRGILFFTGLGMMLQGQVFMCPVCSEGPPEGVVNEFRANNLNWFVQDDWKFSKRLTLNLGLRWEYFGYPYSKYGNLTNIDPALIANVPTPTGPTTSGVGISMYVVPANYMNWPGRTAPPRWGYAGRARTIPSGILRRMALPHVSDFPGRPRRNLWCGEHSVYSTTYLAKAMCSTACQGLLLTR